jgi:hypothetical protein
MSIMEMEGENKIETVPIDRELQRQQKAINLAIEQRTINFQRSEQIILFFFLKQAPCWVSLRTRLFVK